MPIPDFHAKEGHCPVCDGFHIDVGDSPHIDGSGLPDAVTTPHADTEPGADGGVTLKQVVQRYRPENVEAWRKADPEYDRLLKDAGL